MGEVKALRAARRWTQQQLAAQLGVSVMTIKNWEAGRKPPSATHAAQLTMLWAASHAVAARAAPVADREILRLGQAVRRMGLKDEGHGRRSDHTIRKAIKRGRLPAWKAPGYRPQYAEWCFYADDFDVWRAQHYQGRHDPRGAQ